MMGGGVAVIAGEGRRIEYTKANAGSLEAELKNLIAEAAVRGLVVTRGGAINVEIC